MKNKLLKMMAMMLSVSTIASTSFPSLAYEVDEDKNSIEEVEYQNTNDDYFDNSSLVFAEIGSQYKVTIPKVVVLSGTSKDARYFVKVEGDIAGYETVRVEPEKSFNLYAKNKDAVVANIDQDKIIWHVADFDTDAVGYINANDITAGSWTGIFYFNLNLESVLGDIDVDNEHNWKLLKSKEATCTEEGFRRYICTDCKETKEEIVQKLGHTPGRVERLNEIAATCTEKGLYEEVIYCATCGEEISRTTKTIYALGHNIVNGKCTRCGLASGFYGTKDGVETYISWSDLVNKYGLNLAKDGSKGTNSSKDISTNTNEKYTADYIYKTYNLVGELLIDDSVTSIGSFNIYANDNITGLTIGANTDLSKGNTLRFLRNLQYINISENNPYYTSIDGVVFTKDLKTLIKYPASKKDNTYNIPDKVVTIKDCAFQNVKYLQNVITNEGLETIEFAAFADNRAITNITFSSTLKEIKNAAFSACVSITSINIPASVTKISEAAFQGMRSLTSITFEDPDGWYRTTNANYTNGTATPLTDDVTNATYFVDTYKKYYWYKQ